MIARLPEMHRQLRELAAQVAALTDAMTLRSDAQSLPGLRPIPESGPTEPGGDLVED